MPDRQIVKLPASKQSADHATDQSTRTAATVVTVSSMAAGTTGRAVIIGLVAAADAGVRR